MMPIEIICHIFGHRMYFPLIIGFRYFTKFWNQRGVGQMVVDLLGKGRTDHGRANAAAIARPTPSGAALLPLSFPHHGNRSWSNGGGSVGNYDCGVGCHSGGGSSSSPQWSPRSPPLSFQVQRFLLLMLRGSGSGSGASGLS